MTDRLPGEKQIKDGLGSYTLFRERRAIMTNLPTAGFSDAMGKMQTMDAAIKSVVPGAYVMGPAFTVNCYPGAIITCHKALGEAPAGCVLVVNGDGDANGALWGELTSMEAMKRGILGIVVDGAVRDVAKIRELKFPVFARYITPRVGSNKTVGTTRETISCGKVTVHDGDWIVGDDDGVVVVPKDKVDEIIKAVEKIEENEAHMAELVSEGGHIADMIGMTKLIVAAEG